ncbi:MAG: tRNA epoxyqueuosine(34) reductase QueG [Phycisphaerales bacterium]
MPDTLNTNQVTEKCRGLGFALAGVAGAEPSVHGAFLRKWLDAGKHGTMEYLARNTDIRERPGEMLPAARSVIMVADLYHTRGGEDPASESEGRIAKYARGRDYHKVMKNRLHALCDELRAQFPGAEFRAFVDTAPVPERELAQRAGLGWIGKHTLLIHPKIGSWLLLGGVLTSLEISAAPQVIADHCGTCTRCIDACPTSAITPYSVDASRCISYLTIENRGPVPGFFQGMIGNWIYGCDVCQDVCPHNSAREPGSDVGSVLPDYLPRLSSLDPLEVMGWSPADRERRLGGTAMTRANLGMMKRNAAIVAANAIVSGCEHTRRSALVQGLRSLSENPEFPEVADLASEILRRLGLK